MTKEQFQANLEDAKKHPKTRQEIREAAMENVFGSDEESLYVCIEEFSEITKEITKYLRGKGDPDHLLEELSQARIAIWQLQAVMGIEERTLRAAEQASLRKFYPRKEESI